MYLHSHTHFMYASKPLESNCGELNIVLLFLYISMTIYGLATNIYLKWICYSYITTKRVCFNKQLHSFVEKCVLRSWSLYTFRHPATILKHFLTIIAYHLLLPLLSLAIIRLSS